eukprot:CAMPEP_0117051726 /NCGR_PEP_ID=MMETSP0472-20121206/35734_1 /TAXON_ID=693140 ORGANISM="Tiarina fusus, Strain LIS" /NCGR_SAMPLE_ID=MMETSP0472 /ASSEMBLY_ACC=CAM_ASM_000603 /LENGTH=813 /DNA_ID=CAMNT_0004766039 /DNA_START=26 /DNA_END=2464 /DNA_ORIENTATION=+
MARNKKSEDIDSTLPGKIADRTSFSVPSSCQWFMKAKTHQYGDREVLSPVLTTLLLTLLNLLTPIESEDDPRSSLERAIRDKMLSSSPNDPSSTCNTCTREILESLCILLRGDAKAKVTVGGGVPAQDVTLFLYKNLEEIALQQQLSDTTVNGDDDDDEDIEETCFDEIQTVDLDLRLGLQSGLLPAASSSSGEELWVSSTAMAASLSLLGRFIRIHKSSPTVQKDAKCLLQSLVAKEHPMTYGEVSTFLRKQHKECSTLSKKDWTIMCNSIDPSGLLRSAFLSEPGHQVSLAPSFSTHMTMITANSVSTPRTGLQVVPWSSSTVALLTDAVSMSSSKTILAAYGAHFKSTLVYSKPTVNIQNKDLVSKYGLKGIHVDTPKIEPADAIPDMENLPPTLIGFKFDQNYDRSDKLVPGLVELLLREIYEVINAELASEHGKKAYPTGGVPTPPSLEEIRRLVSVAAVGEGSIVIIFFVPSVLAAIYVGYTFSITVFAGFCGGAAVGGLVGSAAGSAVIAGAVEGGKDLAWLGPAGIACGIFVGGAIGAGVAYWACRPSRERPEAYFDHVREAMHEDPQFPFESEKEREGGEKVHSSNTDCIPCTKNTNKNPPTQSSNADRIRQAKLKIREATLKYHSSLDKLEEDLMKRLDASKDPDGAVRQLLLDHMELAYLVNLLDDSIIEPIVVESRGLHFTKWYKGGKFNDRHKSRIWALKKLQKLREQVRFIALRLDMSARDYREGMNRVCSCVKNILNVLQAFDKETKELHRQAEKVRKILKVRARLASRPGFLENLKNALALWKAVEIFDDVIKNNFP